METIQAVQTKDYIAQAIREEILSGRMEPGEELAQETIAELLGVSRMPVREALQALAQEGFLVRLPNRHMKVVGMQEKQLFDTFCVMAAMETEMEGLLDDDGRKIMVSELKRWKAAVEAGQRETAALAEMNFHRQLPVLLDNLYLGQLYSKLLDGYVSYAVNQLTREEKQLLREIDGIEKGLAAGQEIGRKAANEAYFLHLAETVLRLEHGEERHE